MTGPVEVYWNVRRRCWSVRQKGRVVAHVAALVVRDAAFKVSEAGWRRAVREGRKNVHAVVRGSPQPATARAPRWARRRAYYNPYATGGRFRDPDHVALDAAPAVYLDPRGRAWIE